MPRLFAGLAVPLVYTWLAFAFDLLIAGMRQQGRALCVTQRQALFVIKIVTH